MIRKVYRHEGAFQFEAGGSIDGVEVAYHCSESGYAPGKKVIWLCHSLTVSSDAEGEWWAPLVGPGKLIDTEKYFVICGNMLSSAYGSSSPRSINPATGQPYYFTFPKATVRDIVSALDLLRQSLGIQEIDLLIGTSIGGFQALEWSIMRPEIIRKAVFIATGARTTPWITAFSESQRMALEADPTFRACKGLDGGQKALEAARTIALLSYRCEQGYNLRQEEQGDDTLFADRAASYHRYAGHKFAQGFDAYSYWYLSYSVDSNNVGRGRGGVHKALSRITAESMVIAIDSDLLFPPDDMRSIADGIEGASFHVIDSDFGHDGFLIETEAIGRLISPVVSAL